MAMRARRVAGPSGFASVGTAGAWPPSARSHRARTRSPPPPTGGARVRLDASAARSRGRSRCRPARERGSSGLRGGRNESGRRAATLAPVAVRGRWRGSRRGRRGAERGDRVRPRLDGQCREQLRWRGTAHRPREREGRRHSRRARLVGGGEHVRRDEPRPRSPKTMRRPRRSSMPSRPTV